jgi:ETFB lysine methyltransferase
VVAKTTEVSIEGLGAPLVLSVLVDRQQFENDVEAETAGVWPEAWSLFGVIWPAGLKLAATLLAQPVPATVLEVGCGLAIPSMVMARRGTRVLATDVHPRAGDFLRHNAQRNGLAEIPFAVANWARPEASLGHFDMVVGSDVLYEQSHPHVLAEFMARHTRIDSQVVLTDPDRGNRPKFMRALQSAGFEVQSARADDERFGFRGHVLRATRTQ